MTHPSWQNLPCCTVHVSTAKIMINCCSSQPVSITLTIRMHCRFYTQTNLREVLGHGEVPLLHHAVISRRQKTPPVRRYRQSSHETSMPHRAPNAISTCQIPYSDLSVASTYGINKRCKQTQATSLRKEKLFILDRQLWEICPSV